MRQTAGETPSAGFVRSCRVTAALYCCSSGAGDSSMSEPDVCSGQLRFRVSGLGLRVQGLR